MRGYAFPFQMTVNTTIKMVNVPNVIRVMICRKVNVFFQKAIQRDQVIWDVKHGIGKIRSVCSVLRAGHSTKKKNIVFQYLINVVSMILRDYVHNAMMVTI